jgi:hypothetical protein
VRIVFTGHRAVGTPSEALVDSGRASFVRWNVHPRVSDIEAMLAVVRPERAMPAFLQEADLPALTARLGSRTADLVAEFA